MTLPQPTPRIVRVGINAKRIARSMLYHAYEREPTFRYIFNHEKPGYRQRVRATIREEVNMYFDKDHDVIGVALGERLVGVAFIGHPGARLDVSVRLGWQVRMALSAGLNSTRRFVKYQHDVQEFVPAGKVYTLPLIGIEPEFQQHGLGHLLMDTVHEIVAEESDSVGLLVDTSSIHLHFFQSMGYREIGKVPIGEFEEIILFRDCQPGDRVVDSPAAADSA